MFIRKLLYILCVIQLLKCLPIVVAKYQFFLVKSSYLSPNFRMFLTKTTNFYPFHLLVILRYVCWWNMVKPCKPLNLNKFVHILVIASPHSQRAIRGTLVASSHRLHPSPAPRPPASPQRLNRWRPPRPLGTAWKAKAGWPMEVFLGVGVEGVAT